MTNVRGGEARDDGKKHGLVTCPWCDWWAEAVADTIDECVIVGQRLAREHNIEAGHRVRPGQEARPGYRKGEPVS